MNWVHLLGSKSLEDCERIGRVFKMDDGGVIVMGNVNALGGVCDDCKEMRRVVAYSDDLLAHLPKELESKRD